MIRTDTYSFKAEDVNNFYRIHLEGMIKTRKYLFDDMKDGEIEKRDVKFKFKIALYDRYDLRLLVHQTDVKTTFLRKTIKNLLEQHPKAVGVYVIVECHITQKESHEPE